MNQSNDISSASEPGAFVFHLCAADFRGTTLYPLNHLRAIYPDLYAREQAKYVGRESVMSYMVPGLGVAWCDAVNLSALDPRLLVADRRHRGVPFSQLLTRRLLCIPVERIAELPAVRYDSASHWINSRPGNPNVPLEPPNAEFSPFDAARYAQVREVPRAHRQYLQQQLASGEPALGFVFIPHVLVAAPIDVSGIALIDL